MEVAEKPRRKAYKRVKKYDPTTPLGRLIDHFGGNGQAAIREIERRMPSATYRNLLNWTKKGYIPTKWAAHVEIITEGAVTAMEVCTHATEATEQARAARSE
jgi:ribosomal protein L15